MTTDALNSAAKRRKRLPIVVALISTALGTAVTAFILWHRAHHYHLATVQQGVLYRDGLKSATQFAATLDAVHPKTVVSLIDPLERVAPGKPQLAEEDALCAARGIHLVRIPVTLGGWPTSDDIRVFLKLVADPQNQPVIVHCAQGVRRTGFFVAAYQESLLGYDKAKAKDSIVSFGHSGNTIDDVKRFIDGYDPATQAAPGDLGHSHE